MGQRPAQRRSVGANTPWPWWVMGVNDAPALAAADVGLAMGGGSDVAMHAAGITLLRGDPALVGAALDISRRTVRKIRQNLFWAFAYNAAGIPLAALGYLSPVLAGAAMALSSVSVVSNALLLKRCEAATGPLIGPGRRIGPWRRAGLTHVKPFAPGARR